MAIARLGILGGTFDPIHYGHLAIAEEARQRFALERVLFMPAGEPPHKEQGLASGEQRYLMTVLATADHPAFDVSRLEIDRPGPSFTVETLRQLHARLPHTALFLIMGADMAVDFPKWREPEAILALARIIVATRPGIPNTELERLVAQPGMERLTLMPAPGLDISSTALRQRLREGYSLRYLTPDAVAAYMAKERLYRISE